MKRRAAFTLIELLVVIAIIALLVSILMPSLQKAKELAKDVVCRSNLKNVSYAIYLYAQEQGDNIPNNRNAGTSYEPPDPLVSWEIRVGIIADHNDALPFNMRENRVPELHRIAINGYVDHNRASLTDGIFKCPTANDRVIPKYRWPTDERWQCHYSINAALSPKFGDPDDSDLTCVKITDIRAGAVLIGDCHVKMIGSNGLLPTRMYLVDDDGNLRTHPADRNSSNKGRYGPWPLEPYVHPAQQIPLDLYGHTGDAANMCYTDGHVGAMKEVDPKDWSIQ